MNEEFKRNTIKNKPNFQISKHELCNDKQTSTNINKKQK